MSIASIKKIEYVLGEKKITNNDLKTIYSNGYDFEKFEKKVGIKSRFISEKFTTLDLAYHAAEKLFESSNIDKKNIDFLILCTQSPEYLIPTNSCILQNRLGLNEDIGTYDYNLGCSGYVYGLSMAKGLVETNQAKNILLITSETYSRYLNEKDFINRLIFSDAASATLIVNKGKNQIKNFSFKTKGSDFDKLIVKNNFFTKKLKPEFKKNGDYSKYTDNDLFMDGKSIFEFTIKEVPKFISRMLEENNLEVNDVNFYILHQPNKFLLESIRKRTKIPKEKFIIDIEKYGNIVSNTIPIVLKNKFNFFEKFKGRILLCGFGVGLSMAGCIIENK